LLIRGIPASGSNILRPQSVREIAPEDFRWQVLALRSAERTRRYDPGFRHRLITAIDEAATPSFALLGNLNFSAFFQQNAKIRVSAPVRQVEHTPYA
jgi:hypothetical protein